MDVDKYIFSTGLCTEDIALIHVCKTRMLGRLCRMCMIHRKNISYNMRVSKAPFTWGCGESRRLRLGYLQHYTYSAGRTLCEKRFTIQNGLYRPFIKHIRSTSTNSKGSTGTGDNIENFYSMNYIYVKTSIDRWLETPDGVLFDVGYVDSMPDPIDSKVPVVLGLPSSVGSHTDLMNVLLVFVKYGCRVIIPNMPSTRHCFCRSRSESTVFSNSPDEKAEFVRNFLTELDVKKLHLLVTDSDSVYTGIFLLAQNTELVQSFAMINPTGFKYTRNMEPLIMYRTINLIWDEIFYMQPFVWFLFFFIKMLTSKRHLTTNEFITFAKTIRWLDIIEVRAEIETLTYSDRPCMAVYIENCKELDQPSTEEMLHDLGMPQSSITVYDEQDNIVQKGTKNGKNCGVLIKGNHVGNIKETKLKLLRTKLLEFYKSV